eukprot:253022-Prymnesium_polylepis.1
MKSSQDWHCATALADQCRVRGVRVVRGVPLFVIERYHDDRTVADAEATADPTATTRALRR